MTIQELEKKIRELEREKDIIKHPYKCGIVRTVMGWGYDPKKWECKVLIKRGLLNPYLRAESKREYEKEFKQIQRNILMQIDQEILNLKTQLNFLKQQQALKLAQEEYRKREQKIREEAQKKIEQVRKEADEKIAAARAEADRKVQAAREEAEKKIQAIRQRYEHVIERARKEFGLKPLAKPEDLIPELSAKISQITQEANKKIQEAKAEADKRVQEIQKKTSSEIQKIMQKMTQLLEEYKKQTDKRIEEVLGKISLREQPKITPQEKPKPKPQIIPAPMGINPIERILGFIERKKPEEKPAFDIKKLALGGLVIGAIAARGGIREMLEAEKAKRERGGRT